MDQPAAGTVNKNADDDAAAFAAVEQHHASMLKRLSALTATLIRAVRTGDTVAEHDAHEVLVEWCETELVPHALAEEGPLYGGRRNLPQGRLLVEGMLAEHQVIVGTGRGSAGIHRAWTPPWPPAPSGTSSPCTWRRRTGSCCRSSSSSPELSLARAVEGLQELVGETHVHGDTGRGTGGQRLELGPWRMACTTTDAHRAAAAAAGARGGPRRGDNLLGLGRRRTFRLGRAPCAACSPRWGFRPGTADAMERSLHEARLAPWRRLLPPVARRAGRPGNPR